MHTKLISINSKIKLIVLMHMSFLYGVKVFKGYHVAMPTASHTHGAVGISIHRLNLQLPKISHSFIDKFFAI